MLSDSLRSLVKRYQFLLTTVWVGMTLSILLNVGIVYYIFAFGGERGPGPSHETLDFVFRLAAVSLGIASILWRRSHVSDERLQASLAREVDLRSLAENRQTGQVDEGRLLQIQSLSEFEQKLLSLASTYHLPFLIPLALNLVIATLGVVLAFLTVHPGKMFPFAMGAILLNALMFPRLTTLLNRASLLVPPEMYEGSTAQSDRTIDRAMDSWDRLTTSAILALVGAAAYIVGGFLMEGNRGIVVALVGILCFLVGAIRNDYKAYQRIGRRRK